MTEEEEGNVRLCNFCGKPSCNCCPKCGSPIDWDAAEPMCDKCGWAQ